MFSIGRSLYFFFVVNSRNNSSSLRSRHHWWQRIPATAARFAGKEKFVGRGQHLGPRFRKTEAGRTKKSSPWHSIFRERPRTQLWRKWGDGGGGREQLWQRLYRRTFRQRYSETTSGVQSSRRHVVRSRQQAADASAGDVKTNVNVDNVATRQFPFFGADSNQERDAQHLFACRNFCIAGLATSAVCSVSVSFSRSGFNLLLPIEHLWFLT